jgi:hypothetical protein
LSSLYESVPGPGRVVRRWGHWASHVLIAAILVTIAIVLRPLPYDSPAVTLVPILLVLTVGTSWLLMRQHDRRLCEDCLRGLPLNPAQDADRFRRRLMLAHLAGVVPEGRSGMPRARSREAMRGLSRRVPDAIYRQLLSDAQRAGRAHRPDSIPLT